MSNLRFVPGLELDRKFYFEILRPLLEEAFPGPQYSAALLGYGSDALGYVPNQYFANYLGVQGILVRNRLPMN